MFTVNSSDFVYYFMFMYENCTFKHKPKLTKNNKLNKEFDNGCKVLFSKYKDNYHFLKGTTIDLMLLDEYNFTEDIQFTNIIQEIFPTMTHKKNIKALTTLGSKHNFNLLSIVI